MIGKKDENLTILIGKFEDAAVFCGDKALQGAINPEEFLKAPFHEVNSGKHVFRFVNPDKLSEESIATLSKTPNCLVFDRDLTGLMFNISKKTIRAEEYDMPEY